MASPSNELPPRWRLVRSRVTPARVVAIFVIALLVAGLGVLSLVPGSHPLSVPAGAKAGNLTLHSCSYHTDNGSYAADCGTLTVPENRNNPSSRLIAVPVTRIRAHAGQPGEPLFWLEGGPGQSNMHFPQASRFAADRDVVLVGYRGADGSSILNCPEVVSALQHSTDFLSNASFSAEANAFGKCAKRLSADGVDLAGYSMTQQADDLEAARQGLGYGQIDLLSQSAGTRLAMIYAWRYPSSVRRSVMLDVNPPGNFIWSGATTDQQLARYAALCAQDSSCRKRTNDLVASMRQTSKNMPGHWLFFPIKSANVRVASFYGLMETTTKNGPINGPATVDSWLSAAKGDPSGFWMASVVGDLVFPKSFVWGENAAVGFQDAYAADAYFAAGGDNGSILGNAGTDFIWGGGNLSKAWPVSPDDAQYRQVRTSNVETLLIGGELDMATPPQNATNGLLPYLPNGHQVVLAGIGHTNSFWSEQKDAANRLVNTFLTHGQVDQSLYKPGTVNFSLAVRQTRLAKIVATSLIALSLLTLLSLLWWMPRKVQKRGGFGPRAAVAMRSGFAVLLGLGGWFLGVVIVLATMPGVRIDNESLAILSVGVAVGLGTYWAWLRRDESTMIKWWGLAVAMLGGLIGAWFGFSAMGGAVGAMTAIVGAVAVTNLGLIVFDMFRPGLTDSADPSQPVLDLSEPSRGSEVLAPAGAGAVLGGG